MTTAKLNMMDLSEHSGRCFEDVPKDQGLVGLSNKMFDLKVKR